MRGCVECINVNRQFKPSHYRSILKVALPVGLEAVFQASFSLIDQIIVGSLGATAVAAVGLSNNLSFILTLLYAAIGTGSGAFIAQAFGRRNMDEVSKIAALGQTAAFSLGSCSSIPLLLFPIRFCGSWERRKNWLKLQLCICNCLLPPLRSP